MHPRPNGAPGVPRKSPGPDPLHLSTMPRNPDRTAASSEQSAALAMILLRTPLLPNREQLLGAVGENRSLVVQQAYVTGITLIVAGSPVMVGLMPIPVPWSNLERPCATAWWWPDAADVCRSANAHAVVFLKDDTLDVFERNLRITEATALLLRANLDAVAVYWGAGTLLQPRDAFIEQADAASREYLQLYLWVDFRVEERSDPSRFYATTGLKALGLMEIECTSTRNPMEVVGLLFNIAHYLCDNGLVLKDGDTIGLSNRTFLLGPKADISSWV